MSPWSARSSPRSVGRVDGDLGLRLLDLHARGNVLRELAERALHLDVPGRDRHGHAGGNIDGSAADSRHRYQTKAITSPPTPRSAAWRFVITPTEVDMMAVPSPPRTRGSRSLPRVDAAAGLGDALEVGDDAAAIARELQLDDEHAVRERLALVVGGLDDAEVLDVALVLEDARDLLLHLGGRHRRRVVQRTVGVANPGQHVGDRVGEHVRSSYQLDFVIPGTAPWCASSRRQIRHTPNLR